jgi:hypothetical protein
LFKIGKITFDNSLTIVNSDSCVIDQLILIPEKVGVSFLESNVPKTIVYDIQSRNLTLEGGQMFRSKPKVFSFQSVVETYEIDNFVVLDLKEFFNNDGISVLQKPGNFDNLGGIVGVYLPADEINEGLTRLNGIPFKIIVDSNDNIRCNGQMILLPQDLEISRLYILASANHGDYKADILIDNSLHELKITDWCDFPNALIFNYRYTSSGEKQYINCGISLYTIEVNKSVRIIKLPEEINIHIFAITVERKSN